MPRKKRRKNNRRKMKSWSNSLWAWVAGGIGVVLGSLSILAQVSKHVGLPDRVLHVENSTKALAEGQMELGRRVDVIGNDLAGLRREVEAGSRRNETSFGEVTRLLNGVVGTIEDLRKNSWENHGKIVELNQKTINALNIADEAKAMAFEAREKSK